MKYIIPLLIMLTACYPTFKREQAKALLETHYSNVKLYDYYDYPNCSKAHSYATAWAAQDDKGRPISGVLCCDSKFDCLAFEKIQFSIGSTKKKE